MSCVQPKNKAESAITFRFIFCVRLFSFWSAYWANACASTTVDAFAWIDFVFVCSCRDSAYWALSFACTTADAIAFNFVSHTGLPPFYKFFLLQDNCKQNACRYPSHLYFNISQKKINQYCKIYCSELLSYPIFLHRLCEKVSISFLILQQDRHFR